jgi:hypothetical protein
MPISVYAPVIAPEAAPIAAPASGIKKISPISEPQKVLETAPQQLCSATDSILCGPLHLSQYDGIAQFDEILLLHSKELLPGTLQ